tara:strand:+ start:339 stop:512 length:174 start_codon:yes stop_codon:yes gene_type:complete
MESLSGGNFHTSYGESNEQIKCEPLFIWQTSFYVNGWACHGSSSMACYTESSDPEEY